MLWIQIVVLEVVVVQGVQVYGELEEEGEMFWCVLNKEGGNWGDEK